MKRFVSIHAILALAAAVASTGAISAPSYGNIGGPGVYFGDGNVDGNWTIDTSGGVQAALRIKDRATTLTIDGSSGVYQANPGLCNPICGSLPKANWNYELSVNTGALDLTNFFVFLELDTDASAAVNYSSTINVLNNWPDAEFWNGTSKRSGTTPVAGEYVVQQSVNPLFGDSGYGYLLTPGLYDLRMSVYAKNAQGGQGALVAQVVTEVSVPEPSSFALVGLAGLMAAGTLRKRAK